MARPVSYNIHEKPLERDISIVDMPEGHQGEGFFASKLSDVVGLARKNSLWPLPFATKCCGIEFMATMGSHYDLARFGSERVGFSPRQCDLLMVIGLISKKMAPVVRQVYLQMAEPRWVMAIGACASSGGIFDTYSVLQGVEKLPKMWRSNGISAERNRMNLPCIRRKNILLLWKPVSGKMKL
jgi:NADH-quinone oxidoreductase subunit B